jgi:hypothetical protein
VKLGLSGNYRLRVCKNWALRGIFGHKKEEMITGWRKQHNEKLHNLNSSLVSRRMRWAGRGGHQKFTQNIGQKSSKKGVIWEI